MTERQAALTSWHEYTLRVKGAEQEAQERWNVARWICWQNMLLSPYVKKHNKPSSPQGYCRFPWEQSSDEELAQKAREFRITDEETAELNRIIKEWEAGKKPAQNTNNDE